MQSDESNPLTPLERESWARCQAVGEDFTRLSIEDQQVLTQLIERQLKGGSAHFREHAEAWFADALGPDLARLLVGRRDS